VICVGELLDRVLQTVVQKLLGDCDCLELMSNSLKCSSLLPVHLKELILCLIALVLNLDLCYPLFIFLLRSSLTLLLELLYVLELGLFLYF
jgi:hypothetical protein